MKLIEYMGCGIPIVANKVTEANIVVQAKSGVIVERVEEFAEAIIALLRDPFLRKRLGENGREFAREFDWDYLARRYETEVFERFVND